MKQTEIRTGIFWVSSDHTTLHHLSFQEAVQKADGNGEDSKVMEAMLSMLHSLMSSTEVYLKHKSISSQGGFAVAINGIKIFKVSHGCSCHLKVARVY